MQKKTPSASTLEEPQFMKTAGLRVRYRVRGDGPALLMINGIGLPPWSSGVHSRPGSGGFGPSRSTRRARGIPRSPAAASASASTRAS